MANLTERLDVQLSALAAERVRIDEQAVRDIAEVDAKMATLTAARRAVTKEIEAAYRALLDFKLIREI